MPFGRRSNSVVRQATVTEAKARGSVLTRAVRFLRRLREDARKVLPEDLQHYLSEIIEPTGWYPERDLQGILRACIQLMIDTPEPVAIEEMGRWAAREHYSEIFPDLATSHDVQVAAVHFQQLVQSFAVAPAGALHKHLWLLDRAYHDTPLYE